MQNFRHKILGILISIPLLIAVSGVAFVKHTCHHCNKSALEIMTISNCCESEETTQHCDIHAHQTSNHEESSSSCCTHNVYIFAPESFSFQDVFVPAPLLDVALFDLFVPELSTKIISPAHNIIRSYHSLPKYIVNRLLRL